MKILRPDFEKRHGLVTVVTQEAGSGRILMVASTDEAGFMETLKTGNATYWSTSRKERWCKGETSGAFQRVRDIRVDCDGDAVIYVVVQEGDGACHTGAESCFYRSVLGEQIMEAPKAGEKEKLATMDIPVNECFL